MSLRGRDVEQHPSTIDEYLRAYPDDDPFGRPYDDSVPVPPSLVREMERLSIAALTPASTNVTSGLGDGPPLVPTHGTRAATPPRSRAVEPTSDVHEPGGSSAGLA